ncbi:MAG: helix-turn-helix domain-containing protein [Pyrinomonadaceae bacterium]
MSLPNKVAGSKSESFEGASERRKYRMEIPNLIDDLGLSPQAFRLFCRIRRVAGQDGICYQATKTLATACRMSTGTVSAAKRELLTPRAELGGKALITVSRHGRGSDRITITDVWSENFQTFSSHQPKPYRRVQMVNGNVHYLNPDRSNSETKKEPVFKVEERTQEEEREDRVTALSPASPIPEDFVLTPQMQAWAASNVPHVDPDLETRSYP